MLQLQATGDGFAFTLADGSVIAWGFTRNGLDSTALQDQLKNVEQVQATQRAFTAMLDHGSVITWVDSFYGGDSSAVQDQLKNAQQIQTMRALLLPFWLLA